MHVGMLLAMAADGMSDRVAVGSLQGGTTFGDLAVGAARVGAALAALPGDRVAMLDLNSPAVPLTLFGAAAAGKPFVPLNYRLADDRLCALAERTAPTILVAAADMAPRLDGVEGILVVTHDELLAMAATPSGAEAALWEGDPDSIAVMLYTSGTTGEPKAAVLRHRNLASYVISTVEFTGAAADECALVSVPPYHVAAISGVLSTTYSGRRLVYLDTFDAAKWVGLAEREAVTHAMVVPTMLGRILDVVEDRGADRLRSLRSLSYGGGPMSAAVIERAVRLLPHVGFVNAYGLTETSSTVAVLGPDDHKVAFGSADPVVRARLGSVGRPLPSIELTIRDPLGAEVPTGFTGEIWARGEQVAGEYLGRPAGGVDGWFATRDTGHLDDGGYLYVHGRLDDVIVRGGENLSPGEIEEVLLDHPSVAQAAVVGTPDPRWGEVVVAAVVLHPGAQTGPEELRSHVRERLRSTMTPERIEIRAELPFNETGKLLRRVLRDELSSVGSHKGPDGPKGDQPCN